MQTYINKKLFLNLKAQIFGAQTSKNEMIYFYVDIPMNNIRQQALITLDPLSA